MTRIKEILREKQLTVNELAEMLEISRQALSKQIQGKMLVETAERIATTLNVPMWQLFASPNDVKGEELTALIQHRGDFYKATTISELEEIVGKIKEKAD